MPQFEIDSKNFKSVLKTLKKFSDQSIRKNATSTTFTINREDGLRMVMNTDHAFVCHQPAVSSVEGLGDYTFNPDTLLGISFTKGNVNVKWEDKSSPLSLRNGRLKTLLKVAVNNQGNQLTIPNFIDSIGVPLGILEDVTKYLSIPFVFYKYKKETMPVRFFQNQEGTLSVSADDGYSLGRVDTNIKVEPLDIKVPKYILDCLFSKVDSPDQSVNVKVHDLQISLNNGNMWVFTAGMTDNVSDMENTLSGIKDWKASLTFSPVEMVTAIKPLVSLLPAKDKSGAIVVLTVDENSASLSLKHSTIGEGQVDKIEGVSEIHLENGVKQSATNMHPLAFLEYSKLLDFETAKMTLSGNAVLYEASELKTFGQVRVRYLFPTVLV